jgi:hypothetical protein
VNYDYLEALTTLALDGGVSNISPKFDFMSLLGSCFVLKLATGDAFFFLA